mmetsp:Transcript_9503/g.10570  ORF Transcript_9503/g.10570 Transcript_9503/m.10570 type:complete len:621 (-) Transcript_9503:177-2039(-)
MTAMMLWNMLRRQCLLARRGGPSAAALLLMTTLLLTMMTPHHHEQGSSSGGVGMVAALSIAEESEVPEVWAGPVAGPDASQSGGDLGYYKTKISRHASKRYKPTGRELWSLEEDDNQDIPAARNETMISTPALSDDERHSEVGVGRGLVGDSMGEFIQKKEPEVFDVVIIGAGWAGITAAKTLMNKGVTNIKVLEARDEIGGRSRTVMKSIWQGEEDYAIDLGSAWIHGVKRNPIENVAAKNGIPYMIGEELTKLYTENYGGAIPDTEYDSFYQKFVDKNGEFYSYQEELQCSTNEDQSMKSIADEYKNQKDMSSYEKGIFDFFLDTSIAFPYGASLETLSLWRWDNDEPGYKGYDAYMNHGYSELITAHAKGAVRSIIDTNSVVASIDTKSKGIVKIEYTDTSTDETTKIVAKRILVTVSLGALKEGAIQFKPQLRKRTLKGISRVGMGLYNKIVMFWADDSEVFWPKNVEWLGLAGQQDTKFEFYNPYSLNGGKPVLVGFVSGNDAKYMEDNYGENADVYDGEMSARAMVVLQNMFGPSIPDPKTIITTQWGQDEFAYGSYSFNKLGVKRFDRKKMCKPLRSNRIFFAGEACSRNFGTTHGAYLSGKKAGTKIAKVIK